MNLLQKSSPLKPGYNPIMGPDNFPLKYLKFGRLLLDDTLPRYSEDTAADEVVVTILGGTCSITVEGQPPWEDLGERASMLAGLPTMAYIPRNCRWTVERCCDILHAAVFSATARKDTSPAVVRHDQAEVVTIGTGVWKRSAALSVVENVSADRLLVGETYNLPGQWSSYPPHKHDSEQGSQDQRVRSRYEHVADLAPRAHLRPLLQARPIRLTAPRALEQGRTEARGDRKEVDADKPPPGRLPAAGAGERPVGIGDHTFASLATGCCWLFSPDCRFVERRESADKGEWRELRQCT